MHNIAMIVFSYYPADPRVRREAEALVEAGCKVDVFCLRDAGEKPLETIRGVETHRAPLERKRGSKFRYMYEYGLFIFLACWMVAWNHLKKRYRIVHVHNMPDVLVFSALIPRLFGARVILDLHDPMPEVFIAKYDLPETHKMIRALKVFERWSIRFAHAVITPNITFKNLFVERGCPADKITIVMNAPQETIFLKTLEAKKNTRKHDGLFHIMFHGTVVERHGLDTALDALNILKNDLPDLRFRVFGDGDFVETFLKLREEKGLTDQVQYHGKVSLEVIAENIVEADLGLIPNKRSPFTEINMPTRIFEYLSMHKPVIVPGTRGILDYFDETSLFFFQPDDPQDLARVIRYVYENPLQRAEVLRCGRDIYQQHRWAKERKKLYAVVSRLLGVPSISEQESQP